MNEIDDDKLEKLVATAAEKMSRVRAAVESTLVGQTFVLNQTLISLLANGHILLEGVPGLGKTLLVKTLTSVFSGKYSRIQFTPDLMPADVTGHSMLNMKTQEFEIRQGPVFANFLLADEINRAPAKTQAALLEVMQEAQVTIEGKTLSTPKPFMVLATQNPIEQDGTYPLPEAELDRFMMKVFIDYPENEAEIEMAELVLGNAGSMKPPAQVATQEDLVKLQALVRLILVDRKVVEYAVNLVRATREWPGISRGAGPRGSIALLACAKAAALMDNSPFVTPDHVKAVATPVLRHRLLLSAELQIEGVSPDVVLYEILQKIEVPRT